METLIMLEICRGAKDDVRDDNYIQFKKNLVLYSNKKKMMKFHNKQRWYA